MADHNIVLIANRKFNPNWKEGDPEDAKDRSLRFPIPEGAYNAEMRDTAHGYVVTYDQREERRQPDSLILETKEERFLHTRHYLSKDLSEDGQFVRFTDWTPVIDKSILPADWKQPANSYS